MPTRERLSKIERELAVLQSKIVGNETYSVPIESLAPDPIAVRKTISMVIRPSDGEFLATFFDANISTTGDTPEEAIGNLKSLIVDIFENLETNERVLGPEPKRQLAVLRDFLKRRK